MCGLSGFYNSGSAFAANSKRWETVLEEMGSSIKHRSSEIDGSFISEKCCFAQTSLSISGFIQDGKPLGDAQKSFAFACDGTIYNINELKDELKGRGHEFLTASDNEVLLHSFMEYGADFISKVDGVFAISLYDRLHETLYLFRDSFGIKPLYFTILKDGLLKESVIFASEIKALFRFPGIKPVINRESFCEVFGLGPAKTPGNGVFKDINEVLPGQYLVINRYGIHPVTYWRLRSEPHYDSYDETIEKTSFLVTDAIKRQMVSNEPICTLLSGGLDSSLVSAVCARELAVKGRKLYTFSFDFTGNSRYFKANSFQPSEDRPYVEEMVRSLNSRHEYLECSVAAQTDLLYESVLTRDLPTMADVDSSLLYFCSVVKDYNRVVLTGECADEVFGGYPWLHNEDIIADSVKRSAFPWARDLMPRKELLKDDFLEWLRIDEYAANAYECSVKAVNILPEEDSLEAGRRKISYLKLKWFMQTLLDRMDRAGMYSGLDARVPFADRKLVEYLFNVPWEMKARDGVVKNLLRKTAVPYLPDRILHRRKSPYPKTYNPEYENILAVRLGEVLEDSSSPLHFCIDKEKVKQLVTNPKDYGKPWYGQLMAGPQMMAYLLQVNYWLATYQ